MGKFCFYPGIGDMVLLAVVDKFGRVHSNIADKMVMRLGLRPIAVKKLYTHRFVG